MTNPLSIDDLFTVGVSFDLLGGYLLGRGLLASPSQIARRGTTYWGSNPADTVAQIQSGADGRIGLTLLAVGFIFQAGGYVALTAGASVDKGPARAVASALIAMAVAVPAWYYARRIHWRIVKRLVVDVARVNPSTGAPQPQPDGPKLLALGQELRLFPDSTEIPGPGNPGALNRYAKRNFGIDRVSDRLSADTLQRASHQ